MFRQWWRVTQPNIIKNAKTLGCKVMKATACNAVNYQTNETPNRCCIIYESVFVGLSGMAVHQHVSRQ